MKGTGWMPLGLKRALRRLLALPDRLLSRPAGQSAFAAGLFYALLSPHFSREHRAVLWGRRRFQDRIRHPEPHSPFLRRGIHRLEKGLLMEPRRASFGDAFIGPLTEYFCRAQALGALDPAEGAWARDVLTAYFAVVEDTPEIAQARRRFEAAQAPGAGPGEGQRLPYPSAQRPVAPVSYEALLTLAKRRRSVRWYEAKPVPADLLERALALAAEAPSACNRQPFWIYQAEDASTAQALAACAGGTAGWVDNIPCTLVLVGDLSNYPRERDRHLIYIDGALFAMQLMLALETLGLSSCPVNWPDTPGAEKRMAKLLKLTPELRPVMLLTVGYAREDGAVAFSQKKAPEVLLRKVKL